MRQGMVRRLFAAAAGVAALAGSASAQFQTQQPPIAPGQPAQVASVSLPQPVVTAQPAPGPTVPTVPALTGAGFAPPVAGAAAGPGGAAAATPGRSFYMAGGYFGSNCQYGHRCNNGCGSLRADAGFAFGPCKSFFAPCGPGLVGGQLGGHLGGHLGGYGAGWGGRGRCGPFNPCSYDSNLNH